MEKEVGKGMFIIKWVLITLILSSIFYLILRDRLPSKNDTLPIGAKTGDQYEDHN